MNYHTADHSFLGYVWLVTFPNGNHLESLGIILARLVGQKSALGWSHCT